MGTTISTATIAAAADETFGHDNLAPLVVDWRNLQWSQNTELIWGKNVGKLTLEYDAAHFVFRNMSPTIPPEAKILSAILRMTATVTSLPTTFDTLILVLGKDGFWNPATVGPGWRKAGINKPFDHDVHLLSTGLATIVDTAVPLPAQPKAWALRSNALRHLRVGQSMTVATAGTLGFGDVMMVRASRSLSSRLARRLLLAWSRLLVRPCSDSPIPEANRSR